MQTIRSGELEVRLSKTETGVLWYLYRKGKKIVRSNGERIWVLLPRRMRSAIIKWKRVMQELQAMLKLPEACGCFKTAVIGDGLYWRKYHWAA